MFTTSQPIRSVHANFFRESHLAVTILTTHTTASQVDTNQQISQLLLSANFLLFISRVYYSQVSYYYSQVSYHYFVEPASGTGMAYIQRDCLRVIAASMRRRLLELDTERYEFDYDNCNILGV